MKSLKVLIVSNQLQTIKILNWKVDCVSNVEEALEMLQKQDYKVIAIESAITTIEKNKFETLVPLFNPEILTFQFGSNDNLPDLVNRTYWANKRASLNHMYLDNAFELEVAGKIINK